MKLKKYFLISTAVGVAIIGLLYGVSPQWFAQKFLGIAELDVDLAHILRAVMCLYLALGLFWLWAALSDKYRNTAILTTMIFAGGLVIGRIISFFADGQPAPILEFYILVELVVVTVAYGVFRFPE